MESEIFGHVKEAFTGATVDRMGAAQRADGGTLFPDEICEMPLDLQVKGQTSWAVSCMQKSRALCIACLPVASAFFNVFGPRQDPSSPYSGVNSISSAKLRAGQDLTIFGDDQQTRDFVYVSDVVRHLMAGMEGASIEVPVFNVCTGRETSVLTLAETMADLLSTPLSIEFQPARNGDIRRSLGSPVLASAALRVAAETRFAAGLEHLFATGS